MPAAGHLDGLGAGQEPDDRRQAPLREADRALAAGRDRPRALHPLLPLRSLQPGGRRGRAAAAARARRPHLRRHLRRPPLHRALPRQHHRPLPGRGADLLHLPLPRPSLGHRAGGLGLHALPEPVQRQLHGPRRAGEAGVARDNPDVDDGWLCDRGRYGFEMFSAEERVAGRADAAARRAGRRRSPPPRGARGRAEGRVAAIVGDASNEEGYLVQRIVREALGSAARRVAGRRRARPRRAGAPRPARADGEGAGHRLRRPDPRPRHRPAAQLADPRPADPQGDAPQRRRLALATERPTTLDGGAEAVARYAPGEAATSSPSWPGRSTRDSSGRRRRRGSPRPARAERVVVVWGERIAREARPAPRRCSTSPPRSTSPAARAPGCWKCPSWPTPAACARPAACPTPAPA